MSSGESVRRGPARVLVCLLAWPWRGGDGTPRAMQRSRWIPAGEAVTVLGAGQRDGSRVVRAADGIDYTVPAAFLEDGEPAGTAVPA